MGDLHQSRMAGDEIADTDLLPFEPECSFNKSSWPS
jgi:hypothetical protein